MKISTCSYRPILVPGELNFIDYQVDTYIGCSHYCHYCYVLNQAETDWSEEILIHKDITGQLNKELDKIPPQAIFMGYYSDPYQPCEAEYYQTGKVLELFLEKGFSAVILTKSTLVSRDFDLLKKLETSAVGVSAAFTDNNIRRLFEDKVSDTENRIRTLCKLKDAGIPTFALISPVIPYITDVFSLIDSLAPYTDNIWIAGLYINDPSDINWKNIQDILDEHFPDLKKKIETVIMSKNHPYWNQLRQDLLDLQNEKQIKLSLLL
ncbi:MAG: radical SAM protein [bacterium]|nr:radical SAM protein [bacterium]